MNDTDDRVLVGWREWVALPAFSIDRIKAKIDTGARTSSIHAFEIELGLDGMVRFALHPVQRDDETAVVCEAPIADRRVVRSSNGAEEERLVVVTDVVLGAARWPIEMTLTNRDEMGFRMLLGREALRGRALVDPGRSYLTGRRARRRSTRTGSTGQTSH